MKINIFRWKIIEMYGHDQNIGSPEKFCLCDVEHFGSFFSKMDLPSK